MYKAQSNFKSSGFYLLVILVLIISMGWIYQDYTNEIVNLNYSGVRFKNDDLASMERVTVKVHGIYRLTIAHRSDEFKGTITIDNQVFDFRQRSLKFNQEGMANLDHGDIPPDWKGMIYIHNGMRELTMEHFQSNDIGVHSPTGLIISAPCTTRDQAITLAHKLIRPGNPNKIN